MGYWGWKPFQNDSALDALGGITSTSEMEGAIWRCIRDKDEWLCTSHDDHPCHEVLGIILQVLGVKGAPKIAFTEDIEGLKAIKKYVDTPNGKVNAEVIKAIKGNSNWFVLSESQWTILSAATISTDKLKKMCKYAMQGEMSLLKRYDVKMQTKVLIPETPGEKYSEIREIIKIIGKSEDGSAEVNPEELWERAKVYNLAARLVANNFEGIKRLTIRPETLVKLSQIDGPENEDKVKQILSDTGAGNNINKRSTHIKNKDTAGNKSTKIVNNKGTKVKPGALTVIKINKVGNKIDRYECTDGKQVIRVSKKKLAQLIDWRRVTNATKQIYKGQIIIRIKEK